MRVGAACPLAGVGGRMAGNVAQDIPAAGIEAEVTGCVRVSGGFQVSQYPFGERTSGVPGAADGVADADDLQGVVPAAEPFLLRLFVISWSGHKTRASASAARSIARRSGSHCSSRLGA